MVVEELRRTDRFVASEPIAGTFGTLEVSVTNLSLGGAQVSHTQPIRIGTTARLSFREGEADALVQASVLWSHVTPAPGGSLTYRTGLRIENADAHYALALNTLIRAGAIERDSDSLARKRKRDEEREEKKKSGPKAIPISEPPPA